MKKNKVIVFVAIAVVALFLFGVSTDNLTGKVSTNIIDCYDSDGGEEPEIGGNIIGSFDPTKAIKDFCADANTVGEYYCDAARSDGALKKIPCEFGCIEEGGFGICKSQKVASVECGDGCAYNGKCLATGTRVAGRYCGFDGGLRNQKEGGCDNSYECASNLCISGSCLTEEGGKNFLKDVETTYFWE